MTAKKWETHFDNIEPNGLQGHWNIQPRLKRIAPLTQKTNQLDNMGFINWLIREVLQEPEKLNSFYAMRLLRDLNYGAEIRGQTPVTITRKDLYDRCMNKSNEYNFFEELRCGLRHAPQEDYIIFANRKR